MARVTVTRVREVVDDDPEYIGYLDYMTAVIGGHMVCKSWRRRWLGLRGFTCIDGELLASRGHRKKLLSRIRRDLGLSKTEFSRIMGAIGGLWSKPAGTYMLGVETRRGSGSSHRLQVTGGRVESRAPSHR